MIRLTITTTARAGSARAVEFVQRSSVRISSQNGRRRRSHPCWTHERRQVRPSWWSWGTGQRQRSSCLRSRCHSRRRGRSSWCSWGTRQRQKSSCLRSRCHQRRQERHRCSCSSHPRCCSMRRRNRWKQRQGQLNHRLSCCCRRQQAGSEGRQLQGSSGYVS